MNWGSKCSFGGCGYQLGIVEIIRSVDAKYDTFYWFRSFSRDILVMSNATLHTYFHAC